MSNKSDIDVNAINITPEDVDTIVEKAMKDPSIQVLDYKLVNESGEILGLTTSHSQLKVNIQRSDTKSQETLNCFVKSFPHGKSVQTYVTRELSLFDKEAFFFNTIAPLLTSKYDIKKSFPLCFLAKSDKIVMENLKNEGYQIHHTFFDKYEFLKSAMGTVASFHSGSILAEAYLNRNSENRIPLNERFPEVSRETIFTEAKSIKDWFDGSVTSASNIAKYIGKDPEDVLKKFNRLQSLIRPTKNHFNVILHSDLWKNNIMFDEAKPLPNCILIDFQTTRYGPMVLDVLQLLHLNSSSEFRIKHEKELVDYYHTVLEETVSRNDPLVSVPTREEINLGLEEFRIFGVLLSCLYFPLSMLDPAIMTNLASDEKKFLKVISGDRTDFILEHLEKDECYKAKVVGVITELAEIS